MVSDGQHAGCAETGNLNLRLALANAIDRETMMTMVKDGSQAAYFNVPDCLATGPDGQGLPRHR